VTLLAQPGQLVTREELYSKVWPNGTYVDFDEGLNTGIKKLRYALGDSAEAPLYIETVTRRGYRFLAPVSIVEPAPPTNGSGPVAVADGTFPVEAQPPLGTDTPVASQSRRKQFLSIAAVCLFVLSAIWWMERGRKLFSRASVSPEMEIRMLTHTGHAELAAISPDGLYVAYAPRVGENVSLRMRQVVSGGDVEILAPEDVEFVGLTFSPDGNYLYFIRSDKNDPGYKYLFVAPALGGPARKLITDIDSPISFSPDGRQFVFTRGIPTKNQTEVRIANVDATSDHLVTTLTGTAADYQPGATWSPDGRSIAVAILHVGKRIDSALDLVSPDGGQREIYSIEGYVGRPMWHRSGNKLFLTLYKQQDRRGQLWSISLPSGFAERITNDLTDYDTNLDLTRDGTTAVSVESVLESGLWIASGSYWSHLDQVNVGEAPLLDVLQGKNGSLIGITPGELWSSKSDGSSRTVLTKLNVNHLSECGKYLLAEVYHSGIRQLMRLDADGTHATILVTASPLSPACSPDARFVFYADLNPPQRIMRVSIEGGIPAEVARIPGDGIAGSLAVSHDGNFVAFPFEQFTPVPRLQLALLSVSKGAVTKSLKVPGRIYGNAEIIWSPNDSALQYAVATKGVTNLWEQPVAGGKPKQLTRFNSDEIFRFNWTQDHKKLLLARGSIRRDVVLISNFK